MQQLIDSLDRSVIATMGSATRVIVYESKYGTRVDLTGVSVFDRYHTFSDPREVGFSDLAPSLWLREESITAAGLVPTDDREATVAVDGEHFKVHDVKPDGSGGILFRLMRVEPERDY